MTTVIYKIPAIHCKHCTRTIELELSLLEGIRTVIGDPTSKKVEITFDAPANEKEIKALLIEINYPPDPIVDH